MFISNTFPKEIGLLSISALLALPVLCRAEVVISELSGASSDRLLKYSESGQASLGVGLPWFSGSFDDDVWETGSGPFGFGGEGVVTDLSAELQGKSPSMYLRKTFTASASQAGSAADLLLSTDYDDGLIVFLNGVEVIRCHMGPPGMFIYSDQAAFNSNAGGNGPEVLNLGRCSDVLVEGENVIAIQVANHEVATSLRFSGALRIQSDATLLNVISDEFASANGASTTHQNIGGAVTTSSTGVPVPGAWLSRSPAVESSGDWDEFEVTTVSAVGAGESGDGAISYTVSGVGEPALAVIPFPEVEMNGFWNAGAITPAFLGETKLSFRFKGELDTVYDFVMRSPDGAVTVSGFPVVVASSDAAVAYWRFDEDGAVPGATISAAVDSSGNGLGASPSGNGGGAYSNDVPGAVIFDPLSNRTRSNQFSMDVSGSNQRMRAPDSEDFDTSFTAEMFIKIDGEPTGYNAFMRRLAGSTRWQIDFDHAGSGAFGRVRTRLDTADGNNSNFVVGPTGGGSIPASRRIWIDTDAGNGVVSSYNDPSDWAKDGDGINDVPGWHHVALSLDEVSGVVKFYYDYQLMQSRTLSGLGGAGYLHPSVAIEFGKFSTAYDMLIDEVRYTGRVLESDEFLQVVANNAEVWSTYEVDLASGDFDEREALLDHLNANNFTSFIPALRVREESYSPSGKTLTLDRFSVEFVEGVAENTLVSTGDDWRYHAGTAEPSGGVYEPGVPGLDRADFVDWIELENTAAAPVDLTGWSLSDDAGNLRKWTFPEGTTIPGNGHLLVLADDLDTSGFVPVYLHANFKLSSDGEYLALVDQAGVLRTEFAGGFSRQLDFYSFGLRPGDVGFVYLEEPSPGLPNAGVFYEGVVGEPSFGMPGGFYDDAVSLTMTTSTPGAAIRYTTDGTEPTLENGLDYTLPLLLSQIDSQTGHAIRARAFAAGQISSSIKSASYLVGQSSNITSAPALLLSGDRERSFTKPNGVLAIEGGTYEGGVGGIWGPDTKDDYNMVLTRGRPFERPAFVEFYSANSTMGFAQNGGLRVAASNQARPRAIYRGIESSPWEANSRDKPSFNLYFRNEYEKSSVTYPIFGEDYPVSTFEQLRPRAGKNDMNNPHIKDEVMRRLFIEMGNIGSRGVFNSLYLNGEWKGFYNTCERLREPFFQSHYRTSEEWDIRQAGNPNGGLAEGDDVAWDELNARLQAADVNSEVNWNLALELVDPVAMADYFLVNIYGATWDWPNNNWASARERSPEGRYRFYVWDAEGAFGHPRRTGNSSSEKPVNFNTITTDLLSRTDSTSRMFQRLQRWPEFRLILADRIQKHFFNGGTLDDSSPADSRVKAVIDEATEEVEPLITERFGETMDLEFWNYWTRSGSSRRSYLLGPNDEHFRDAGYWPQTEPPAFSQHGGEVGDAFELAMNAGSGTIYYTFDGSDPRRFGGVVATGAQVYAGPVSLPSAAVTVKARLLSPGGEWSAVTEAEFRVGLVQADSSNLVISEIHYHPAAPNAVEQAAGYLDQDDFEFIQLRNIGSEPLDLSGVALTDGVLFDFSDGLVTSLGVGSSVIVAQSMEAFRTRYGSSYDSLLAGQYGGTFSNGGEQVTLARGAEMIRSFTYDDRAPWPEAADGAGVSLVLLNPESNPDHAVPENWVGSASIGGLPGGQPLLLTYSQWQSYVFGSGQLAGPTDDPDGDGLPNLVEFFLGSLPGSSDAGKYAPKSFLVEENGERFLTFRFSQLAGQAGLSGVVERSGNLENWSSNPGEVEEILPSVPDGSGRVTRTFRVPSAVTEDPEVYLRLRVLEVPAN